MKIEIRAVDTASDLAQVRELFTEYAGGLGVDLDYQGFSAELAGLPGYYAAPRGRLMLARTAGAPAGCGALRPRNATTAEIKRLYVRPAWQGHGVGRQLAEHLIAEARRAGYTTLWLDTLPTMAAALRLYERLGFVRRDPYFDSPMPGNVFMELSL